MKRMIAGASALAIAATTALPAFALTEEVDMLEVAAQDTLQEYNVEGVDVTELTLAQIAQIRDVANSEEPSNTKQRKIEAIVGE